MESLWYEGYLLALQKVGVGEGWKQWFVSTYWAVLWWTIHQNSVVLQHKRFFLEGIRIAQGKNRYLTDGFDTWCFAWKRDPCKFGSCQNFNPELQSGTRIRNKKRTIIWYKKYLLVLEGNKIIALVILRFSEMLWSIILPRNQWAGRMNHKLDFLTKTVWNFLHKASPLGCFM